MGKKQPHGYFHRQQAKSPLRNQKGHLKRETKSFLIAVQNNGIRTKYVKVKIDKLQQNSKCSLYGDRDETINHIISEWNKLTQNVYKTWHDWVGTVIYW